MNGATGFAIIIATLATSTVYWFVATRHWMKRAIIAEDQRAEWEQEFSKLRGISHNFLTSCRLIAIHRNGRVNVFTFARGDKNFTIETMGMLSDLPQTWRELAGLQ